jgi:hypothetical protein
MIDRAPQVMHLPVDPYKHLVQVPPPVRIRLVMNPLFPDLCGEHRTEPVPDYSVSGSFELRTASRIGSGALPRLVAWEPPATSKSS